ncbi:hypothetical protein RB215_08445 [Pseudoalteromonas sp. HL-AS2]|mgnify:CR=1 FL=1|uniref:hypothetical protein n=1 Tax=Pseudoalteromonas sp. HL-AS2 TaxID=3071082 RepID=UPI002814E074|nr:hypothetical protein [Pseudoalteromonas sp. HL-AS2]WMS93331.1 hypothetical protein RB215_08445 [Pseudoalteromonas sp. HL-AS2]
MKLYSRLTGQWINIKQDESLPSGLYAVMVGDHLTQIVDDGSGKYQQGETNFYFDIEQRGQADKSKKNDGESLTIAFDAIEHIVDKFKDKDISEFSHLLPPEVSQFIKPTGLDQAIEKGFEQGVFQTINQRPRMSMRYDVELMATSRVKRYASNYQAHLVAHSECWQQRTFTGIIPKKLKGQISEDEIIIYENIVYARLIDHLLRYIAGGQARIQQILDVIKAFGALDTVNSTHHYVTQISNDWGRAFGNTDIDELEKQSHDQIEFLNELKSKLIQMKNGALHRAIPQKLQIAISLKSTNILMHDEHYQRLATIWRTWSKISANRRLSPKQLRAMKEQRQINYTDYVTSIITQIFSNTGWKINPDMTSVTLMGDLTLNVENNEQGVWVISHDNEILLRLVVNAEPLEQRDISMLGLKATCVVVPQIKMSQAPKNVFELSPLNLHGKESLARYITSQIWCWLLTVYMKPLPNNLPTPVKNELDSNHTIYNPLTHKQLDAVCKQANSTLVERIKLKSNVAQFVRHCPYCGDEANEHSFNNDINGYFKGQCKNKSCGSVWTHDPNNSSYFKLNDESDTSGRYAFSLIKT